MKNIFSMSRKFYRNNGFLGVCLNNICQLRGGDESLRLPHSEITDPSSISSRSKYIDDILDDDDIAEIFKKPFRRVREDPRFPDFEMLKQERFRKSLMAKSRHPIYSKIKGKVPYAILSPFTFTELARLACYRVNGYTSAPLTMGAIIGFSMPCAVTFSMLEMYAPDKLKFPYKCAKWSGGLIFYGVSSSVDYLTSGVENKFLGEELPIDAPELMGTLPTTADLEELKKTAALAKSIMEKSSVQN